MNTIKDTDNYKVYEELIEGYDYFYTLEKTSYPYYLLTHIDIYRKNVIKAESDVVIGSEVDSIHYEKFIVKKYILNYIYQKKDLLSTPVEEKKKLSIFKRIKNKKIN